jgi:hypothetical protein
MRAMRLSDSSALWRSTQHTMDLDSSERIGRFTTQTATRCAESQRIAHLFGRSSATIARAIRAPAPAAWRAGWRAHAPPPPPPFRASPTTTSSARTTTRACSRTSTARWARAPRRARTPGPCPGPRWKEAGRSVSACLSHGVALALPRYQHAPGVPQCGIGKKQDFRSRHPCGGQCSAN